MLCKGHCTIFQIWLAYFCGHLSVAEKDKMSRRLRGLVKKRQNIHKINFPSSLSSVVLYPCFFSDTAIFDINGRKNL